MIFAKDAIGIERYIAIEFIWGIQKGNAQRTQRIQLPNQQLLMCFACKLEKDAEYLSSQAKL